MMFISGATVPEKALEKLRTDAYVEVDRHGRMRKYEAIDGSLELEGDHGWYAVMNAVKTDITRQSLEAISRGRKRAREESLKAEDDSAMDFDNAEDSDYDPLYYEKDKNHILVEKKPESLVEVKREVPEKPSTSIGRNHCEDNFFGYNQPTYGEDLGHIPVEKKPESFTEVKLEVPEEPSTSNLVYNYEENLEHAFIKPKQEID